MLRNSSVRVPEQNLPLKMARASLDDLPTFALPTGFSLRWYQPGDEAHWRRIHLAAERFLEISPEFFCQQFGGAETERGLQSASPPERKDPLNSALLHQRQCYLLDPRGEFIGTGTAWFGEGERAEGGRVHWMAIVPEFQARGLGKALMSAICQRLRDLVNSSARAQRGSAK